VQRHKRLLALFVLALALFAMSGCQNMAEKATEAAVEKATGVDVEKNGDSVTVKTDEGEATVSSDAKLPDDFPQDVPIYENATIETAITNKVDAGTSYLIGMKSDDDAGEVYAWYKQAFEDEGWTILSSMEVGDSVGGLAAEKDTRTSNLSIGYGAEKKAEISLTVAPKQ
jgi:hypothetical protein